MNETYLKQKLNDFYDRLKQQSLKFLELAGLTIEAATKRNFKMWTEYGTGATAASIISIITEEDNILICKIGSPSKVFVFREFGTSPHKTNKDSDLFIESVTKWGKRQGMNDEEINTVIFLIRKHGTKPKPALYPAFYENKDKILDMARSIIIG